LGITRQKTETGPKQRKLLKQMVLGGIGRPKITEITIIAKNTKFTDLARPDTLAGSATGIHGMVTGEMEPGAHKFI
jgi:hypothetical protein